MEYERDDKDQEGGLMQRIKESPRTVSAVIIILIVAAAIYAFSGDQGQQLAPGQETPAPEETAEPTSPSPQVVPAEQLAEESATLPEATRTETGYMEVAQAGDGITHLARRATTRWLSENQAGYEVTNEHRIYIEDYIQNRIGTEGLALGETRTISFDLVQEAVASAGQLNQNQLRNLRQYTYVLS